MYAKKISSLSLSCITLGLTVALLFGCTPIAKILNSVDCSTQAVAGLEIRINNAIDDSHTCPIDVRAIDGDYIETLECLPIDGQCSCLGAWERPGLYEIEIYQNNTLLRTLSSDVKSDVCHVITEKLEVDIE